MAQFVLTADGNTPAADGSHVGPTVGSLAIAAAGRPCNRSSLAAWPAQQLGSQGAAVVGQAKQVSATNANLPYLVVYFEMTLERKFAG